MSDMHKISPPHPTKPSAEDPLVQARREKLRRWREDLGVEPYGHRVDGIIDLAEARGRYDEDAHAQREAAEEAGTALEVDPRPAVTVAGRCVQHRAMGKLVFAVIRDHSGDLQISVSKADVPAEQFKIAAKLDYGDVVAVEGRMGKTRKGEVCVWAESFAVHAKSLVPPPEKYHGLTDAELRYRQRYVDMFANPETVRTFKTRSTIVTAIRQFMHRRQYLEVETPIMQPLAGGAAARPFVTRHNALDLTLYLRIAPELYLKRLLVGGLPRVFEIGRNFRNEGLSRRHNPEFTSLEVYEAFGDCYTMLELTEALLNEVAMAQDPSAVLPWGDLTIDYTRPFDRVTYGELFEQTFEFAMEDEAKVREAADAAGNEHARTTDPWLLVNELFEARCEPRLDPQRPTFVTDYPAAISPLTRPQRDRAYLCERWELLIGGMEIGTAYTELNDPDVQLEKFREQLTGADEEDQTFRNIDEDFIHALRVGMPPAGGLGLGVDRIVMLLANQPSIRDVILFPLQRPDDGGDEAGADA